MGKFIQLSWVVCPRWLPQPEEWSLIVTKYILLAGGQVVFSGFPVYLQLPTLMNDWLSLYEKHFG